MRNTLPPVFVISLPASVDRRAHMRKMLDPLPLQYEFVDGVDGKQLSAEEVNQVYDEKIIGIYSNIRSRLLLREIGVYMSHVKAYEMISSRNISEALILEDDVYLSPDLIPFLEHRDRLPKDWRLVHIAETFGPITGWHRKFHQIYKNYKVGLPYGTAWGALGYLIRGDLAKEFTQSAYPMLGVIDGRLFDIRYSLSAYYLLTGEEKLVWEATDEKGKLFESTIDENKARSRMPGIDMPTDRDRKHLEPKPPTVLRIKKFCHKLIIRVLVYFFPPKKHQGHPIIGVKDGYQVRMKFIRFLAALCLGWKRR